MAGGELKENPGAEVAGVLRLMMLGFDTGAVGEACMFPPKKEDCAMTDEAAEELDASAGLIAGVGEHSAPGTVTVESNRTVATPSGPLELKTDRPFPSPGLGVTVDAGAEDDVVTPPKLKLDEELAVGVPGEDKGVMEIELEGTIPPKLNVLAADEELSWRLFSLMTGGGGADALRLMTVGEGAGPFPLRLMTEGPPETCGAAA